jgi:probable rRNA maturation factor
VPRRMLWSAPTDMPDRPTRRPAQGRRNHSAEIILEDPSWRRALPSVARLVSRAVAAGGGAGSVLLSSDRRVRALNRLHRGIDKPTNVLTFEPAGGPGEASGGDIVLAFGVVRREAATGGKNLARHLAHLVVHGALHLRGEDHLQAGEARRMEMAEARILRRLGVPNPWKIR